MNLNLKNGIAAKGYDLIEFFNHKAIKGSPNFIGKHQGADYYFSSLENLNKFSKSPEQYLPQYGGFCSIAMSEDKEVDPNPKSFLIQDGKLYFFTRMLFGIIDAKRQWEKDPYEKKKFADDFWKKRS